MTQYLTEITLSILTAAGITFTLLFTPTVTSDENPSGQWVQPTSGVTVNGSYCSQGGFLPASVDLCEFAE